MPHGMNLFGLTYAQFETFILVLVRVSVILIMLPIFSAAQVNSLVRFGLGLIVTIVVWSAVPPITMIQGIGPLTAAVFSQAFVGFVFGFVAFLVFVGIQFAGEVMDLEVGFSIVNVINPLTSQNVSILGEFQLALGSLISAPKDADAGTLKPSTLVIIYYYGGFRAATAAVRKSVQDSPGSGPGSHARLRVWP